MIKFKIFMGSTIDYKADEKVNEWLMAHPEIRLCSYKYDQANHGDHSICIMYEESN